MTGSPIDLGVAAAFVTGLASSAHCLAMCGGIAGALALRDGGKGAAGGHGHALVYNLARVSSYALAGAVVGGLGATLLQGLELAPLSMLLRTIAGGVMLAAALRVLFGWRLLDPLEAAGARLWRRLAPKTVAARSQSPLRRSIALGLAWGALPCAMSYSMLLLAATTASPVRGAAVMTAFGLGTLPSMLGAGVLMRSGAGLAARRLHWQRAAGALLLCFGLWTAGNAVWHGLAHGSQEASAPGHAEGHLQHTAMPPDMHDSPRETGSK